LEVARHRIQELLGHVIGGAKVFLGADRKPTASNWRIKSRIPPTALWSGSSRYFRG